MRKSDAFLENQYQTLYSISKDDKILMVMDTFTKQVFVKRKLKKSQVPVYQQIKLLFENAGRESKPVCASLTNIYEVYEYEGEFFSIEEFVNGRTLKEYFAENGGFEKEHAIRLMTQLCEGILFLHKNNLLHGDLSDNNIMITTDDDLKIIDYGAAISLTNSALTRQRYGTVGFAAPEQFGFSTLDFRTDIFSIGIIFNQLLTGKLPQEEYYHEDEGISRMLDNCLAVEKKNRYNHVSQLLNQLKETGKNNWMKRIVNILPGLQFKKKSQKVLMFFCYLLCMQITILMVAVLCDSLSSNPKITFLRVFTAFFVWLLLFCLPFLLVGNAGQLDNRIARAFQWQKASCVALRFLLALFSGIMGMTVTILGFIFL